MVEKFEQRSPNIASRCFEFYSRTRTLKPSWFNPNAQAVYFSSRTLWRTQCRTWKGRGGRQACIFGVGTTVARDSRRLDMFNRARKLHSLSGFSGARKATASPCRILGELLLDVSIICEHVERNAIDVRWPPQGNRGTAAQGVLELSGYWSSATRARSERAARVIASRRAPDPSAVDTPS
jgi:hypothetical protein